MEAVSKFKKAMAEEKQRQKIDKAKRRDDLKKRREKEGPLSVRIWNFIKRWTIRAFHTAFIIVFIYLIVMVCTFMIPMAMGYIVGGLGYTLSTVAEIVLASLSGLFFTGWVFVGSFMAVKWAGKLYVKNIKKTIVKKPDEDPVD